MSGDGDGFDEAFDRLFRRAYGVALRIVWSKEDAEDVAIETLTRAAERWERLAGEPDGWVTRVAANRAIDVWRRRRRAPLLSPVDEAARGSGGDFGDPGDRVDLARALAGLPRRQRAALAFRFLLDCSEAETAAALGCSVGTVKQHVHRGLAALRRVGLEPDAPGDGTSGPRGGEPGGGAGAPHAAGAGLPDPARRGSW